MCSLELVLQLLLPSYYALMVLIKRRMIRNEGCSLPRSRQVGLHRMQSTSRQAPSSLYTEHAEAALLGCNG